MLGDTGSVVEQPIRKRYILYALFHMPVRPCLSIVNSTLPAFLVFWAFRAIKHPRLACHKHPCRVYIIRSVLVVILSVVKAVDYVGYPAVRFQSRPVLQSEKPDSFQLATVRCGNSCKIRYEPSKCVA